MKDKLGDILGVAERHPSYAQLGFYRVTGGRATPLYGSSLNHRDTIMMRLKTSHMRRKYNEDHYYGDDLLFECEMSYTQFAELISSMNVGDGVPVTLKYVRGEGEIEPCPFNKGFYNVKQQFVNEFKETLDSSNEDVNNLLNELYSRFKDSRPIGKKEREEILKKLRVITAKLNSNPEFVSNQFIRFMEDVVKDSKGEIEAFTENKVRSIAQQSLVQQRDEITMEHSPIDFLETGE